MNVTKSQLKTLSGHKGQLERDSGKVFVTFVGTYDLAQKAFVGGPVFSEVVDEGTEGAFSLSSVITPAKPAATKKPKQDKEATE